MASYAVKERFSKETGLWQANDPQADIIGWERFRRLELLQQCLTRMHGKRLRILEIGCGAGINVAEVVSSDQRWSGVGVDISPAMIASCKQTYRTNKRLRFTVLDIENRALNEEFDVIFMLGVVGYVDNRKAFKHVSAMLKPGGTLFLTYGNKRSLFRQCRQAAARIVDSSRHLVKLYRWVKLKLGSSKPYNPAANRFRSYSEKEVLAAAGPEFALVRSTGIAFSSGLLGRLSVKTGRMLESLFSRSDPLSLAMTRCLELRKK